VTFTTTAGSRIAFTHHATQRLDERLGRDAEAAVVDAVLDAAWNNRWRRSAPSWLRCRALSRRESIRYAVGSHAGTRFAVVVETENPILPVVVTILSETTSATWREAA
jgi:hypothetical protein